MRFNNNSSIFGFYWSISYYLKIILNKISFSILLMLSFFLLILNKSDYNINIKIQNYITNISKPEIVIVTFINNIFNNTKSIVNFLINTKSENLLLRKQNINLQMQLIKLDNIVNENKELKEILNFTSDNNIINYTIKKINIINNNSFADRINISIDKNDNIKENSIVLDLHGNYIGKVINLEKNKAEILLLTDTLSKIPAKLSNGQIKVILNGNGTNFLKINYFLGEKYNINENECVYTSSDGNILQEDILIGKIVKNKDNKYYVKIESNLNKINKVIIINNMD